MKKLIIIGAVAMAAAPNAYGAQNCCTQCTPQIGQTIQYTASCTNPDICNCDDLITTSGGYTKTQEGMFSVNCNNNIATASCLRGIATYSCASGYYGTANNLGTSGCTPCPSNATCAGGNNSTFVCAKGYYKNGSSCSRCPSSGGVYGTTSGTGATSITECYLPSGTTGSDSTGSFTYTSNCYYSN